MPAKSAETAAEFAKYADVYHVQVLACALEFAERDGLRRAEIKRQKIRLISLALLAWLTFSAGLPEEKRQTIQIKLDELLVRFPAQSRPQKDVLASELMNLGQEGILGVCGRLVPPGTADDSLARYALDACAVHVARAGAEKERVMFSRAIIAALKKPADTEIRAFLIGRLQMAGREESVAPLSGYLRHDKLCEPAAQALLAIRTSGAEKAFIKALDELVGPSRTTVIKALGELCSRAALEKILPFASSEDAGLREVSLFALANIGDPRSETALRTISVASSPLERARAASLYLLYARRLAEAGQKEKSLAICREIMQKSTGHDETQVRGLALNLLAEMLGEKVLDDLVQAVDAPDKAYREKALDLAASIPGEGATAKWMAKASEAQAETQAQIIAFLGRRKDKSAVPLVLEKLKSGERSVRLAAIPAAAELAGSEVISDLMPLWRTADEEEAEALRAAFLGFPTERAVPEAAKALGDPDLAAPAKAALIEILAERRADEFADLVFANVQAADESVRKAALTALESVSRGNDLARIIELLVAAENNSEIILIQNALVAAAARIPESEKRAELILEALKKARGAKRIDLLRPLAKIGGEKAIQAVVMETASRDPQVQTVAVHTLSNWTDSSAAPELLKLARTAADRRHVYLALQGYVRLTGAADLPEEKKLELLKEILDIPQTDQEKNLVLTGLGAVRSMDSLLMTGRFLDDPALRDRAARTAARIALPSLGGEGLTGFETALVLKKAAPLIGDEYDREQIENYIGSILLKEGFVSLFNGKDLSGWKGLVGDPVSRARMNAGEMAKARQAADKDMRLHWQVIDGVLVFDGKGQSLCTQKDYGDFEMFVDWKIQEKGDSGIYLRGSPQVQIWDPAQWPEGSGGLYNNQIGPAKPLRPADNPVGEWNTFHIKMAGDRVTVYLNSVLVADSVVMENYWERDKPIYAVGQIELQAHSAPLYFKNIYLREIPAEKGEAGCAAISWTLPRDCFVARLLAMTRKPRSPRFAAMTKFYRQY